MWRYFYSNIENTTDFWMDIRTGVAKQKAKDFIEKINTRFNSDKY